MDKNLGNCVPCEDKGHECPAVQLVDVAGAKEPWCTDCFAGKRVCAYERNERAKAIGIPSTFASGGIVSAHSLRVGENTSDDVLPKAAAEKLLAQKANKDVTFCKCSPDCDRPAMANREYAWGRKPKTSLLAKLAGEGPSQLGKAAGLSDEKLLKHARRESKVARLRTSSLFETKVIPTDEYNRKYEISRGRNDKLCEFLEDVLVTLELGNVMTVKPEKGDKVRPFRDRLRRTFDRHIRKTAKFHLIISQNVKHQHIAIEKVRKAAAGK